MGGDAKKFYLNIGMLNVSTFHLAIELVWNEHNFVVRQNRTKNVLNQLRLLGKMGESQDEGEVLAKV